MHSINFVLSRLQSCRGYCYWINTSGSFRYVLRFILNIPCVSLKALPTLTIFVSQKNPNGKTFRDGESGVIDLFILKVTLILLPKVLGQYILSCFIGMLYINMHSHILSCLFFLNIVCLCGTVIYGKLLRANWSGEPLGCGHFCFIRLNRLSSAMAIKRYYGFVTVIFTFKK